MELLPPIAAMPLSAALSLPTFVARLLRPVALLWLSVALWSGNAHAQIQLKLNGQAAVNSAVVNTPRVQAELVALAPQGIAPGQPLTLGLRIQHQPDWHTYWKNAGDSGLPTQLEWQLPAGMAAGETQWPVPQQIRVGTMLNYGYEGLVLLPVPVTVGPDFTPDANGMVRIQLQASWLVCRVECIPEDGSFTLEIPAHGSTTMAATDFAQAARLAPQALNGEARFTVLPDSQRLRLRVDGLPAEAMGQTLAFYPESAETFHHAAELGKDWSQSWSGATWTAELPLSDMRGDTPASLPIVLGLPVKDSDVAHTPPAQAWRVVAPVEGQWQAADVAHISPALAAALEANRTGAAAAPTAPATSSSLWLAVLGGLLGGLILNLMPCVFPVLAIKLLAFTQPGTTAAARRTGGLAYGAGVIVSFLALGGLLLSLRAAGQQLGWGFQLQSPAVVALLAALFTLIGLNLAGLFELRMLLPSRWASAQARHPVADAFLSGVLAVAIASPCTAPFMGASLGFAVGMPAVQALTVFAALGVGMALPYVLACLLPGVLRWMPRPGAWMDTFRRAMTFPMFATVVWLVWVLGQQSGIDGAAALLGLLLLLAALAWALTLSGRSRWVLSALVLALAAWLLPSASRLVLQPVEVVETSAAPGNSAPLWQRWSAEQIASLQAAGQPAFVDFTAAWCVTCQFNKKTTLSNPAVLANFAEHNVTLLRADWTRRDPAITAELTRLGRSGVPVYVLYAPGKPPQILSELLSADEVQQALAQL